MKSVYEKPVGVAQQVVVVNYKRQIRYLVGTKQKATIVVSNNMASVCSFLKLKYQLWRKICTRLYAAKMSRFKDSEMDFW